MRIYILLADHQKLFIINQKSCSAQEINQWPQQLYNGNIKLEIAR